MTLRQAGSQAGICVSGICFAVVRDIRYKDINLRSLLSFLFLACGAGLCVWALYSFLLAPEDSITYRLAWLPITGIFVAFWADHRILRKQNAELRSQTQTKSDFISVLAHDLKTPMARIQAMAEVISYDSSKLTYEQKQALSQLEKSQVELTNFIDEMVQMSRLDGGSLSISLKAMDINQVISSVIKESHFYAVEKNIELAVELEPLFSFKFDPNLLKQVIQNLVENALKYSHSHSRVLISSEDKGQNIVVQITDEGMGISKKDLPFIFDRFYRAKEAKDFAGKSSGLGLYLAKAFTQLHQGRLEVSSKEGEGTTFTLTLPKNQQGQV